MCFNKFYQRKDIPELFGIFLGVSIKIYFQRILHSTHIFGTDMSVIHTFYGAQKFLIVGIVHAAAKNIAGVGKKLTALVVCNETALGFV